MLFGTFGVAITAATFGLSQNFAQMVASRTLGESIYRSTTLTRNLIYCSRITLRLCGVSVSIVIRDEHESDLCSECYIPYLVKSRTIPIKQQVCLSIYPIFRYLYLHSLSCLFLVLPHWVFDWVRTGCPSIASDINEALQSFNRRSPCSTEQEYPPFSSCNTTWPL